VYTRTRLGAHAKKALVGLLAMVQGTHKTFSDSFVHLPVVVVGEGGGGVQGP
jgi:hypothetical protein